MTTPRKTYPHGVTCFIDTERSDVDAAAAFYGGLFDWSFDERTQPGAPRFLMAEVGGKTVAGLAEPLEAVSDPAWNTYVSVTDADAIVGKVEAAGGKMLVGPVDVGPAGRMAVFVDPEGAQFRVWQAGRTHGAELVNGPGAWNWSDLETRDIAAAQRFYGSIFGWEFQEVDFGTGPSSMIRVPGYGEHLEELTPGTLAGHKELGAPDGFSDAIGWMQPPATENGTARWAVTFSVADADETASRASRLGGAVLVEPFDVPYVRMAVLRDHEGVTFAIGTFKPEQR